MPRFCFSPLRHRGLATAALGVALLVAAPAGAEEANEGPSLLHRVVLYAPNRALDVLDLVRMRVRIGPGVAVGVRATEAADAYVGSYAALYAGLPGPRGRRVPRLPIGFEQNHGLEVSVADASSGFGFGPGYTATEFGGGFHAVLIGADVGFDPFELVDLLAGLLLLDPRGDDL